MSMCLFPWKLQHRLKLQKAYLNLDAHTFKPTVSRYVKVLEAASFVIMAMTGIVPFLSPMSCSGNFCSIFVAIGRINADIVTDWFGCCGFGAMRLVERSWIGWRPVAFVNNFFERMSIEVNVTTILWRDAVMNIHTCNPNEHRYFVWTRPSFGGLTFKDRGQLGSSCINVYEISNSVVKMHVIFWYTLTFIYIYNIQYI